MAERYTRLFSLTENLYQSGAPVMIAAGALLKDNQTNKTLAQIKLQSLSDKPIKAAKVTITPLDVIGNELGSLIEHQYLDLNIQRNEEFGAKSPIYLPDAATRAFRAAVTSVVFADNSVWEASDAAWEPIPAPVTLEKAYPDAELRKQFKLEFGAQSRYIYAEFADLCLCPCGALNRQEEAKCHTCGCDLTALRTLDVGELEKRKDERLEQERIAEEERQERMRVEAEEEAERARQVKKIAKIAIPIAVVAIAFLVVLTKVLIPNSRYNGAISMMDTGRYEEALSVFEELGGYKDSTDQILECKYRYATDLMSSEKNAEAAILFGSIDYKDSTARSRELWNTVAYRETLATGSAFTVGLKSNGNVTICGFLKETTSKVSDWGDIVAVTAGPHHIVGLKTDGTVVASSRFYAPEWSDIVAVSAGVWHTVGLKMDGTVKAGGDNEYGQSDVKDWTNIIAVAAGDYHTVGLKSDGTVLAIGLNEDRQCNVDDWTDIVAIAAGDDHTVGLKSDGTVVACGDNYDGQCNVESWTDIVAIAAGDDHTVGLKSDGTVVACGDNYDGQCNVESWTDIVAVAAGDYHTVGLKSDGTVVAVGSNSFDECDVNGWRSIKLPE